MQTAPLSPAALELLAIKLLSLVLLLKLRLLLLVEVSPVTLKMQGWRLQWQQQSMDWDLKISGKLARARLGSMACTQMLRHISLHSQLRGQPELRAIIRRWLQNGPREQRGLREEMRLRLLLQERQRIRPTKQQWLQHSLQQELAGPRGSHRRSVWHWPQEQRKLQEEILQTSERQCQKLRVNWVDSPLRQHTSPES
jgi:hypothetical protein